MTEKRAVDESRASNRGLASNAGGLGPLAETVLEYSDTVRQLVSVAKAPGDWAPLERFFDVEAFERVGTVMEVQDWQQFTEMMAQWAASTPKFETRLRRISEMPTRVFYEIEERHFRGERVDIVNSMTVFEFDDAGKICHLDVYLQQPL